MAQRFDNDALARIFATVKGFEAGRRGDGFGDRSGRPSPQQLYYAVVTETDGIETGQTGEVSVRSSIKAGAEVRTMDIYNWGCPLEKDDKLVIACVTGTWVPLSAVRGA